jgi:hypothetical protein
MRLQTKSREKNCGIHGVATQRSRRLVHDRPLTTARPIADPSEKDVNAGISDTRYFFLLIALSHVYCL